MHQNITYIVVLLLIISPRYNTVLNLVVRYIILKFSQMLLPSIFFHRVSRNDADVHFRCILLRFAKYDSFTCDLITTKKMRQAQQYNVTYIFKKTSSIMYINVDFAGNTKNLTKNEYFCCHHRQFCFHKMLIK